MASVREDTGNPQAEFGSSYSVPIIAQHLACLPTALLARLKPKRHRKPSLTTIVKQALKAGADRVEYSGAVIYLRGDGAPAPAEAADEWDDLLPPGGGRNASH
jgi:hypothetical protein